MIGIYRPNIDRHKCRCRRGEKPDTVGVNAPDGVVQSDHVDCSANFNSMKNNKQLIAWLNDAYSMERSLARVLENHANDAKDFPEVKAKDEEHLEQTRRHADMVERCLAHLGEKPSTIKGTMGSAMGMVQGAATGMFHDELIKNFLSDYAAEHMEIASYQALIAAAEELGQTQIVDICSTILEEEQDMADWLLEKIPEYTRTFLEQEAATE